MDPCLYFHGCITLLVYINDFIVFGPDLAKLDKVIKEMRMSSKKFKVEDLGNVKDLLGIQVTTSNDKMITLNQPKLIDNMSNFITTQKKSIHQCYHPSFYKRIPNANHSTMISITEE